jgi:phosphatidylinositol alpha-1,6-mannosyltransferase
VKIAYITHNYLPCRGGVETHVEQIAQTLSARHQVRVCAFKFANYSLPQPLRPLDNNLLAGWRIKSRTDGTVQVVSLAPTAIGRCQMLPLLLRATPRLQRIYYHQINELTRPFYHWAMEPVISKAIAGAQIVHSMAFGDLGSAAWRAAQRAGIPFVCTPFVHPNQWGDTPPDVKLYQHSDAVIALLETDFSYLVKLGVPENKLHTIGVSPALPVSIDGKAFRRENGLASDQPTILYLGRMMGSKGAGSVVAAAPFVWRKFPDAAFIFAGPATSEEAAIFRGADKRIRFLGRISDQKKAEALAGCSLLCVPSMSEVLPTVYLEAWSLGKPVVAGMAHGIPELVEGNQAGVCVAQDAEKIAEAIGSLLTNPGRAAMYSESGRKLVEEKYSTAAVAGALEEVYASLISLKEKAYR